MKRQTYVSLILILAISVILESNIAWAGSPFSSEKKKQNKEVQLFNGKNLDGWYTYIKGKGKNIDPNKVFTVQNREIRISGEEYGCITTNNEFENYKITVEFRWGNITYAPRVDKTRDSGLLLHSIGEDGASSETWMYSIECQIIEGGTGDFIMVGDGSKDFSLTSTVASEKQGSSYLFDPTGKMATINTGRINWFGRDPEWKDVKGFRGSKDVENPVGQWNIIECLVKGKEITTYLNGTLVNHAVDVSPQKGKIQIQSEGAEIFFRKVAVTAL